MTGINRSLLASLITLATGVLWGFYWLPVRNLGSSGLEGAWGTLAITLAAVVLLAPIALSGWRALVKADRLAVLAVALGGAAFALYSISFLYGRVGIIILLWFFSPVWSTLIGRFVMGWETPAARLVAVAIGLAGLMILLGAGGQSPLPKGLGEWMSLIGGILWSISTTIIRVRSDLGSIASAFVFALGASLASLALAPLLEPWPEPSALAAPATLVLVAATAALWWGFSMIGLLWAAGQIDPTRVAILLMSEVLVGAWSASVIAGEGLLPWEMAGGFLVLLAGIVEVWSPRRMSGAEGQGGNKRH